MSKVTSKLQLTIPKSIAEKFRIHPGDELEWSPLGGTIRIQLARPRARKGAELTLEEKLALFDQNMARVKNLQAAEAEEAARLRRVQKDRAWKREDLYDRGFSRRH